MNKSTLAVLSLFSFLLIFSSISVAQLGEVAGQPSFNVSIGNSNTLVITVINQASYPLPIKVILPPLVSKDANAITPTVTAFPLVGNIPAQGEMKINVTVYMPGGTNKPGYTWQGVLQVITVPTPAASGSGGATGASILEGVAKIVTVTAKPYVFNIDNYIVYIVIAVVAVIAAVGVLVARSKGMLGGRAKKGKAASAKSKAALKAKGKKATSKKKSTKRKASGKKKGTKAKKSTKSTRRRRR
jgi:hypothetical protein